jgi:probable phosphoglycerate mutase
MKSMPKKTFYFVRHGQTDANAEGLMCGGDWDVDLNEAGNKQSLDLSEQILNLQPQIETLYVSPMKRTIKTAENINSLAKYPLHIEEDLIEWRVGDWEKQPWENVPNPFNTTEDPQNGEAREYFEERVISVIRKTLMENDKTILFVSHGAFAHALFTFMGLDQNMIDNCQVYKVFPKDMSWFLEKVT